MEDPTLSSVDRESPVEALATDVTVDGISESEASSNAMAEYYALQRELLVTTLILMGIVFPLVWFQYDLRIALNYLLGAFTGVLYLRLLGRNVEKLGQGGDVGKSQVAVLAGVMIASSQIEQLSILPVFLGFLTFKAAILVYTLRYVSSTASKV
jgi:ATP synthase protein I